jgi:hypothetical protein
MLTSEEYNKEVLTKYPQYPEGKISDEIRKCFEKELPFEIGLCIKQANEGQN